MTLKPRRTSVKVFFAENTPIDLAAIGRVFHHWIREAAVPGILIDVADYSHVIDGPGVLLVGHEGDYVIDRGHGRPGLLYRQKRGWAAEDLAGRVESTVARACEAARLLAGEPSLSGLSFQNDELEIAFPDRLNVPQGPETLKAVAEAVTAAVQPIAGGRPITLTHVHTEPPCPFTVRATFNGA